MKEEDDYTHFGNERIKISDKKYRVNNVFKSVSSKYDLMNDIMSLGVHRIWKTSMLDWMSPKKGHNLLDVAGGTGDIAFRFVKKTSFKSNAVVLDLTENMMSEGLKRSKRNNFGKNIDWVCGDAMSLPFATNSFDFYSIAFGIRNVTDIKIALKEAFRVLKPGGRFLCLEFSKINSSNLNFLYKNYSKLIPRIGKFVVGRSEPYEYLTKSIDMFINQGQLKNKMEQVGFEKCKYRDLSGGIVAIHSGWKI